MSHDEVAIVQDFLRLMERRDLDAAGRLMAPDARIVFPGGRVFASLEDQVASSAGRFRSVKKHFEGFDRLPTDGGAVVYAFGTLHGEALDGSRFDDVRFIDRFEISAGRIVDQRVWNDLAESGALRPPA